MPVVLEILMFVVTHPPGLYDSMTLHLPFRGVLLGKAAVELPDEYTLLRTLVSSGKCRSRRSWCWSAAFDGAGIWYALLIRSENEDAIRKCAACPACGAWIIDWTGLGNHWGDQSPSIYDLLFLKLMIP